MEVRTYNSGEREEAAEDNESDGPLYRDDLGVSAQPSPRDEAERARQQERKKAQEYEESVIPLSAHDWDYHWIASFMLISSEETPVVRDTESQHDGSSVRSHSNHESHCVFARWYQLLFSELANTAVPPYDVPSATDIQVDPLREEALLDETAQSSSEESEVCWSPLHFIRIIMLILEQHHISFFRHLFVVCGYQGLPLQSSVESDAGYGHLPTFEPSARSEHSNLEHNDEIGRRAQRQARLKGEGDGGCCGDISIPNWQLFPRTEVYWCLFPRTEVYWCLFPRTEVYWCFLAVCVGGGGLTGLILGLVFVSLMFLSLPPPPRLERPKKAANCQNGAWRWRAW